MASDFQPFLKAQHKVPSLTPQQGKEQRKLWDENIFGYDLDLYIRPCFVLFFFCIDDVVYSDNPTVQSCCMSGLRWQQTNRKPSFLNRAGITQHGDRHMNYPSHDVLSRRQR